MKKNQIILCVSILLNNLSHAENFYRHIYNNTESSAWYINFNGDAGNVVYTYNNSSYPHMCVNTDFDPIEDDPGCKVAPHSQIVKQGCGSSDGGICITYDSNYLVLNSGTVYITDPCKNTKDFFYGSYAYETAYIDHYSEPDTGGIVLNSDADGDIRIVSNECFP